MPYFSETKELKKWIADASISDITYHRVRQQLWAKFIKTLSTRGETTEIDRTLFNSIKSTLTSRSDSLTDDKRLAFDTAVQQLDELVGGAPVVEESKRDDEGESPALPPRSFAFSKTEPAKIEQPKRST